ncbi:FHA domain-containing protein [Persicimonas caeni]|uniref:FHA domain-containing protein n=1 Tax=Persicimonas caeni TaxID=2292766 RepID=A0A4Y6PS00_PERCE|nr:FHA domain-containing protein [Persicimonas caeni]QED32333.1 FHA domain-containing protein [Persicimonas caeni]
MGRAGTTIRHTNRRRNLAALVSGAVSVARIVYTDSSNREQSAYLGPDQPVVSIGRATDCTIRSNRKSVSRHHAEFRYNNGTFEVIDLNSSNGTWLIENEQRFEITHERLEDQDEIWCGDFIVHFLLDDPVDREVTVNNQHPSGEQQYVSGPTEAADAFAFGAESSEAHAAHAGAGLEQHSAAGYDYEEVEELGEDDFVEIDEVGPSGGHSPFEQDAYDQEPYEQEPYEQHGGYGEEVERLKREKQSIEDLASRQAFEIEELQAELQAASQQLEQMQAQGASAEQLQGELDAARSDAEQLRQENQQLRQQLESGSQEAAQLESLSAELDQERHQVQQLRSELQRTEDELSGVRRRLGQATDRQSELEREVAVKNERVEALEHDVRTLEDELANTSGSGDEAERMRAQLEQVRGELEKSNRLLNEYERRNADLRTELDEQREANEQLRQTAQENEQKLAELFDTRDELQRQLADAEPMREELADKTQALEEAERLAGDLKAEVQGLKQRLQLERRRSNEDDSEEVERLEAELVEATERIAELEAERDELRAEAEESAQDDEAPSGVTPDEIAALRQRLGALERLADAIDRTDLEPLSTVDRIRLQSAIRETDPKKTLQEALELLE